MDNILSLLFLYSCFGIVLFLLRKQSIFQKIGIFILFVISSIRWDIGNDYMNYYDGIINLAQLLQHINLLTAIELTNYEPLQILLTSLFKDYKNVSLLVISTYSGLTIILWYLTLKRNQSLFWGFFTIFFMGFFFNSWDQMRQSLSIAIFLYSIKYIQIGCLPKYLIGCLIAISAHYSAIILIPFYCVRYIRIPNWIIVIIIGIFFIGFIKGIWQTYFEFIFLLSDTYSQYAYTKMGTQEFGTGLGLLVKVFVYTSVILLGNKKDSSLSNILLAGFCLYLFSCSNEMLERLANYGCSSIIILFPVLMKKWHANYKFTNILKVSLISLMFVVSTFDTLRGVKGVLPYDTIISTKYEQKIFKPRNY